MSGGVREGSTADTYRVTVTPTGRFPPTVGGAPQDASPEGRTRDVQPRAAENSPPPGATARKPTTWEGSQAQRNGEKAKNVGSRPSAADRPYDLRCTRRRTEARSGAVWGDLASGA
ncbi:UmuC protein [Streptomyces sp. NBRC 110611]|nr:UmuC protein [Streptomyces sp. NBRC 110611]